MAPPGRSGGRYAVRIWWMWANFSPPRCRDHLERQVGTFGAAVEDLQPDAELVLEVAYDVPGHVRLGGRGQAQHRRHRPGTGLLPDEAAHVTVIGPEVVPPARQAVRLVQHPAADLALVEHPAQGTGAKLLRRDDQNARISQPDPVQRVGAFGHRQQPVNRHAGADPVRLQPRHLIRHQRDQGRDHHRQRASLVVARQGRDLIAE